eukprot:5327160-Heterocapsa_arctica.AAC.1
MHEWLCIKCGAFAKRPTDLGRACTGTPAQGTCRYWRKQQGRLSRYQQAMEITSGRNRSRSGAAEQPVELGQILRLIRE